MLELWVEKYRPNTIDGYVWKDENLKLSVTEMLKAGALPHLFLAGKPGTGKTTLARMLLNELKIPSGDILEINASHENNVDTVRTKITNFVSVWALGDMKYVLLDEVDYMTHNAQAILRNLMETYSDSARFILTCNHPKKVTDAVKSRCQEYYFGELDLDEYRIRAATVLAEENIQFELDDLDDIVRIAYPDMRKCIQLLQQHSYNGKLHKAAAEGNSSDGFDYMLDMVDMFKAGKINEARKLIVANARPEDYDDIYRFFYNNLDLWGDDEDTQNEAILIIAKGLRNAGLVADQEINLSACMVELSMLKKR